MELGPCRISNASGPHYHPESWTETANIFFVDQPVGVGYSYADYGETVVRAYMNLLSMPRKLTWECPEHHRGSCCGYRCFRRHLL